MKKSTDNLSKITIMTLETMVEGCIEKANSAQMDLMDILIYLKTSGRFKENKRYEKSTFYAYLEDRFNITQSRFMEMQRAHINYPKESQEFGIGTVARVIRSCGSEETPIVLEKFKEAKASSKRGLKQAKINEIINAHRPKIEKTSTDWKGMYEAEAQALDKARAVITDLMKENQELKEQIKRLKGTAQVFADIRKMVTNEPVAMSA